MLFYSTYLLVIVLILKFVSDSGRFGHSSRLGCFIVVNIFVSVSVVFVNYVISCFYWFVISFIV